MARLNEERQQKLEPTRMETAISEITALGYEVSQHDNSYLAFEFKGNTIRYWPYSGWASGKGIVDGRGLHKLLSQIKQNEAIPNKVHS